MHNEMNGKVWSGGPTDSSQPRRRVRQISGTLEQRFWPKVDKSGDCWIWRAGKSDAGYGKIGDVDGKTRLAHRVAYEFLVGPIPEGLTLDHLCHTNDSSCRGGPACPHRPCVNPAHLEPVPSTVNVQRAIDVGNLAFSGEHNRRKTHCPSGHPYDGANLRVKRNGSRVCRACEHARHERKRRRMGAKVRTFKNRKAA